MKKDSYEVDLDDIIIRRGKKGDNPEEIATLIYQTDPYIYPYWFNNSVEEAKKFLKDKLEQPGFIFNYDNLYVAINKDDNRIIGLIVALDSSVNFDFDYEPYTNINDNYKTTINKYIKEVIKEIKEKKDIYIMNCTVLEDYRGKRIGSKLLGYYIRNMESAGYDNYRLDCLLHNLRAKNLYHSLGFKEMEEISGFDGYAEKPVEVVVFKRHKGNYLPEEFQKREKYWSYLFEE